MIAHGGRTAELAAAAGCAPEELLDFSVNLHPEGMPDGLPAVCFAALREMSPYPEPHAETLSRLAAERDGRTAAEYLFGNGSSELLWLLPQVLPCRRALVVTPGYLEYAENCRRAGVAVTEFRLMEAADFRLDVVALDQAVRPGDLVMLGNPNNPTGATASPAELWELARRHTESWFLVDEAFADFSGETLLTLPPLENLIVTRSLTKYYAMAGIRLGYAVATAAIIDRLRERQPAWSVGTLAQKAGEFLLQLREDTRENRVAELREQLAAGLTAAGWKVFPSRANYLLAKCPSSPVQMLLCRRIAVRDCSNYPGLDERFVRVAVRSAADNARLLEVLGRPGAPALRKKRKCPALMLQGTCSNAGKSILTAAFCRILLQDGYAVAPFKAQNMALNSYVTPDGGEIGRAQAVQAEACRRDPDVRMNPILLKPNSDLGSQVILLGKAIGNYRVRDYFARKRELWMEVRRAYDSLSAECDCMVLEGAGSPGEVNLKSTDLVNMRMAQYAEAPVLLAGDIDRGGVYASFIGNYATFDPWEQRLLAGFLVNKFRGDATLLDDAHRYVEKMTGKPVLGVIDYLPDPGLPEEDSVNFGFTRPVERDAETLDIALIRLGHIANFTDFAPLEGEPDVRLRIVEDAASLGQPDAVILPGSKSVASDLARLRENGLVETLRHSGSYLIGICGGLQLLGERLLDPDGVESEESSCECLGVLPLETVMRQEKTLRRTVARTADGETVSGYEIHHGETRALTESSLLRTIRTADGRVVGYETDNVFATYLHGVFDEDGFRRRFLDGLRRRRNWGARGVITPYGLETALNRLADHVRSRVDIPALYRRMGL